jgi:hypothetical protein
MYACQFWADHLQGTNSSNGLLGDVEYYSQILYWLEALSLIGSINFASPALLKAAKWIKVG